MLRPEAVDCECAEFESVIESYLQDYLATLFWAGHW
jgi:hypothetical protein